MAAAVAIAKRSKAEDAAPHPRVGAVLLRDGHVLGSAYRGEYGSGDHAEFTLLGRKMAGVDVAGATLFTTLEPCTERRSHKPCAEWIIEKGITSVLIGILDPNPRIYAQGWTRLRDSGIDVGFFTPTFREEIRKDNEAFIAQFFANPELSGDATFNYSQNDGKYTIGHGSYLFETRWSKASDVSIHVYKDNTNVVAVRLALGVRSFAELTAADVYDASSRVLTPREGEIVVFENVNGHFAAARIVDVKDRTREDRYDSLAIEYRINDDGSPDFSS